MEIPQSQIPSNRSSMILGSPRYPVGILNTSTSNSPTTSLPPLSLPIASQNVDYFPDVPSPRTETTQPVRQRSTSNASIVTPSSLTDASRPRTLSTSAMTSLPLPLGVSAMSEALTAASSSRPGLIRRLSRGAANKLSRRRTSATQERDISDGPVLMRHRSNSNASDSDFLLLDNEAIDLPSTDLGSQTADQPTRRTSTVAETAPEMTVIGPPEVPMILQTGTPMTRITRKKKTLRYFVLETSTARVSWDPIKLSARFYIDDIKEIRVGEDTRNYREDFQISSEFEDRWITIIYSDHIENGKLRTLHLVALTRELFQLWTNTLEKLLRYRTDLMSGIGTQDAKAMGSHWKREISSQSALKLAAGKGEKLCFEDVERMCRRLQVNCSKQYLRTRFDRADIDKTGYLTFEEFQSFVRILKERTDIMDIWRGAVEDIEGGMTEIEFTAFLKEVQKIDITQDETWVFGVFQKFVRRSKYVTDQGTEESSGQRMSLIGFTDFLQSQTYNPVLRHPPEDAKAYDRPLNEYFISTSHNTYLLQRQVAGESSIEGYVRTLQRGCRCVEVDCWDGDDGKPVVTHGRTLTSKVLFSDVIHVIGKYAFVASPYPIIISLEVHCGIEQQTVMADILRNILGGKLITVPIMTNSMVLPSPQDLRNKILVKVKRHDDHIAINTDLSIVHPDVFSSSSSPKAIVNVNKGKDQKDITGSFGQNTASSSNSTEESDELGSSTNNPQAAIGRQPTANKKIAKELGELGIYCRGQKFKNFALPESKTFNHVFSLAERTFVNLCKDKDKKAQLEKHNIRCLMRVYPSGWRVTSRNFDPIAFWRRGVQMVALNWQTYDAGIQLNEAMFASPSERSGYVLKPIELRSAKHIVDSVSTDGMATKLNRKLVKFSIDIISAQQLPRVGKDRECLDSYVEVEVFSADDKARGLVTANGGIDKSGSSGMSGLGAPQRRRTKVVRGNLFTPTWNERLSFSVETRLESLVFIRFAVYSDEGNGDQTLKASYCMKLASAAQGYRHLPLYDMQGEQYLFSSLFVKINVEPSQPALPTAIKQSTVDVLKSAAKNILRFSSEVLH